MATRVNILQQADISIGAVSGSLVGAASCRNFGRKMTMDPYCDLIAH